MATSHGDGEGRASRDGGASNLRAQTERHLDTKGWEGKPWVPPDVEKAEEHRRSLLAAEGRAPLCSSQEVIEDMGTGMALHFDFLCALATFFCIASVIASPILALCVSGTRYAPDQLDPMRMARLSIGNIGPPVRNFTLDVGATSYSARQVSNIITTCEFLICVAFIVLIILLARLLVASKEETEQHNVSARDYAVFVTGLPRDATEADVREHFSGLYNLQAPDWTYPSKFQELWCTRKKWQRQSFAAVADAPPLQGAAVSLAKLEAATAGKSVNMPQEPDGTIPGVRHLADGDVMPVSDTSNSGSDAYMSSWVAEVSLARANGSMITKYQALTNLFLRLRQARATVRKYSANSSHANVQRCAAATTRLHMAEEAMAAINKKYSGEYRDDVVGAFVVFNNELSTKRCLQDYAGSDLVFSPHRCCQARPLRFKGKDVLSVTRAPDPSQIVWQNLEISSASRCGRYVGVLLLMVILLLVSFLFIMVAQSYQLSFQSLVPNLQLCDTLLPAVAFNRSVTVKGALANGAVALPAGMTMLRNGSNPLCPSGSSQLRWNTSDPTLLTSPTASDVCFNECFNESPAGTCVYPTSTAGTSLNIRRTTWVACYCYTKMLSNIAAKGAWDGAAAMRASDGSFCSSVALAYISFNAFIILAAIVVAGINFALTTVVPIVAAMQGDTSLDGKERSTALFTFIALFANTSLIALIINAALPASISSVTVGTGVAFNGSYTSFDARWHAAVGSAIALTLLLNVITPHAYPILSAVCLIPCTRLTIRCASAVTQTELNQQLEPPPFMFSVRSAVILNTVFSSTMYSAGDPITLVYAAMSLILCLLVDRWTLLRIFRRPPRYDDDMARFLVSMLPYALILHLSIAIWMLSDPLVLYSPSIYSNTDIALLGSTASDVSSAFGGFSSNTDGTGLGITDRLSRENIVPLLVLWCIVVAAWLLYNTAGVALLVLLRQATALCCGGAAAARAAAAHHKLHLPPYTGVFTLPLNNNITAFELDEYEVETGWRVSRDAHGQLVRIRVWMGDAARFGLERAMEQPMLTWEVIAHSGIASYEIAANAVYAPAVRAIDAARDRWEAKMSARRDDAGGGAPGIPDDSVPQKSPPSLAGMRRLASAVMATSGGGPQQRSHRTSIPRLSMTQIGRMPGAPRTGLRLASTRFGGAAARVAPSSAQPGPPGMSAPAVNAQNRHITSGLGFAAVEADDDDDNDEDEFESTMNRFMLTDKGLALPPPVQASTMHVSAHHQGGGDAVVHVASRPPMASSSAPPAPAPMVIEEVLTPAPSQHGHPGSQAVEAFQPVGVPGRTVNGPSPHAVNTSDLPAFPGVQNLSAATPSAAHGRGPSAQDELI